MKISWNRSLQLRFLTALILAVGLSLFQVVAQSQRPRKAGTKPKSKPAPPEIITSQPVPLSAPKSQKDEPSEPSKSEDEGGSLRITSNLVAVPVSVTNAAGQPVGDLTPADFQLEEEGQKQRVEFLGEPGKTPLELAVLFDVSGSVNERFQFEQQAVTRFLQTIFKQKDTVAIFSLGSVPKLVIERTGSLETAIAGAQSLVPTKEQTAVFDTVVKATRYLSSTSSPGTRRVIIVISDGEDNSSESFNLPQALRELQQTDCLFYSINPSGPSIRLNRISQRGQMDLATMAQITGGYAFLPDKLEDLESVFQQIATELQAQYLLGYYPNDERMDGKFRRIAVRIPKRPDLRIRARQGYYPPREASQGDGR